MVQQYLIPSLRTRVLLLVALAGTISQRSAAKNTRSTLLTTPHSPSFLNNVPHVAATTPTITKAAVPSISRRIQSSSAPQDKENNDKVTTGKSTNSTVKVVCLVVIAFSSAGLLMWLLAIVFKRSKTEQSIDEWSEQSSWYSVARRTSGRRQDTSNNVSQESNVGERDTEEEKKEGDLEAGLSETFGVKEPDMASFRIVQKPSGEAQMDEWSDGSSLFCFERKTGGSCQESQNSAIEPILQGMGQQDDKEPQEENNTNQLKSELSFNEESLHFTTIVHKNAATMPHTPRGTFIYLERQQARDDKSQTNELKGETERVPSPTSTGNDPFPLTQVACPCPWDSDRGHTGAVQGNLLKEPTEAAATLADHLLASRSNDMSLGSLATSTTCSQDKDAAVLACASKVVKDQANETGAAGKGIGGREHDHCWTENSNRGLSEINHESDDQPTRRPSKWKGTSRLSRELQREEKPTNLKTDTCDKGVDFIPFIRRRGPLIVGQHVESKDVCWVAALKGSRIYIAVAMATLNDLSNVALPRRILHTRFNTMGMTVLTGHFDTDLETTLKTPNCYQYKDNDPVDCISSFVRDLRKRVGLDCGDNKESSAKPLMTSSLIVCRMCISLLIGRLKAECSDEGIPEKTCLLSPAAFSKKSVRSHGWYMRDIREAARVLFKEEQVLEAVCEPPALGFETNEDRHEKPDGLRMEWDGVEWREA